MVSIIIPTYNGEKHLHELLRAVQAEAIPHSEVIVIDSSSADNTVKIAEEYGAKTIVITQNEFDHGATRTKAAQESKGDILVFLTQDALPQKGAISNLIKAYDNPQVGIAFGRQLPQKNATPFAKHLRYFNYSENSYIRTYQDREKFGMKTAFNSDSFSSYRRKALEEIDWFHRGMMGEDVYAAGKILMNGYKIAYVAEAKVIHSHNLSLKALYSRYFEIGKFYTQQKWITDNFGNTGGEGVKFVISEVKYLFKTWRFYLIPMSFIRSFIKLLAYRKGAQSLKQTEE